MLINLLRLLSAISCLEKILDKAQFDTVALLHLNKTADIADITYRELSQNTNFVWMRFNMENNVTLQNDLLQNNVLTKIFSVYFLDVFTDWQLVYQFIGVSHFNHRDNHMYVVSKYPPIRELMFVGLSTFRSQFYNCGFLFWNAPGNNSALKIVTANGFMIKLSKTPIDNDQCSDDIYHQIFYNKLLNFHGANLSIYGQTDPPKLVRTVASVNGLDAISLSGHDLLIVDTIAKHLNATPNYKLMMRIYSRFNFNETLEAQKPENNIEQKYFNVSQIVRYNWDMANDVPTAISVYTTAGFDMNSEKVNFDLYRATIKIKEYTFLYPHDTDSFVLIVPRRFKSKTDYSNLLNSPLIFVWGPITIIATLARFIFNKTFKTEITIADIYFQTFGLSLGMSFGATITTAAENLFLWWFCLATMLSGCLLSSDMLQGFVLQGDVPAINNLKELEMSGMEIHLPGYIDSVKYFFESVPLNFKLVNTLEFCVAEMVATQNMRNAYVMREGKFNILFEDTDAWHVLEVFGAEYLSYKLHFGSGMEHRMNEMVQRCVDHGITKYLIAKNKRLLGGSRLERFETEDTKLIPSNVEPVSISDVIEPFVMYAIGMTLSSIGFIVEKIVFWKRSRK